MIRLLELRTNDIIQGESGIKWRVTVCRNADTMQPHHILATSYPQNERTLDGAMNLDAIFDQEALNNMNIIVLSPLRDPNYAQSEG